MKSEGIEWWVYNKRMVKNQFGGSRAKGLARKNERGDITRRLRLPECEDEKFAIVRKIYGGDMCEILCDDNIDRIGVIRGKFSGGKGKRQNLITPSTLVLVGLRSWASSKNDKKDKCDILEVYSSIELDQLKSHPTFPIHFIMNTIRDLQSNNISTTDDPFVFSTITTPNIQQQQQQQDIHTIHSNLTDSHDEIDIHDI